MASGTVVNKHNHPNGTFQSQQADIAGSLARQYWQWMFDSLVFEDTSFSLFLKSETTVVMRECRPRIEVRIAVCFAAQYPHQSDPCLFSVQEHQSMQRLNI